MKQNYQQNNRDTYSTGSTVPPKNYQGIIAVLLILVTVLCSIVTVLGMMNVRLWNLVESMEGKEPEGENAIAMAQILEDETAAEEHNDVLGMTCQEISGLYRSYNGWPDGLYISHVEPGSFADQGDVRPGDILVAVNGTQVTMEELSQATSEVSAGGVLKLTLYREENQITVLLKVG